MNSRIMETDNIVRDVVLKTVRHTFFKHFCAGEDVVEARRCVERVNEAGLRVMLAFAVEYTSNNDACDQNLKGFLDSVQSAMSLPPSSVRFISSSICHNQPHFFFFVYKVNFALSFICFQVSRVSVLFLLKFALEIRYGSCCIC